MCKRVGCVKACKNVRCVGGRKKTSPFCVKVLKSLDFILVKRFFRDWTSFLYHGFIEVGSHPCVKVSKSLDLIFV